MPRTDQKLDGAIARLWQAQKVQDELASDPPTDKAKIQDACSARDAVLREVIDLGLEHFAHFEDGRDLINFLIASVPLLPAIELAARTPTDLQRQVGCCKSAPAYPHVSS